jgi:nicotinate phosphoribosyltransferase
MVGTALYTDRYELTMVQAALRSGTATRRCVFEVFARRLPAGRRYGVLAGVERVAEAITSFRFGDVELSYLAPLLDAATCEFLAGYRFTGDVDAFREGELWFPGSPVLSVSATFAEAVMLETVVLSILNFDSAVAAAASRIAFAAGDRGLAEMGSRRVHEEAAVAAARAAYVGGVRTTSNLEAGRRYGIPTMGTSAHAFVLAHGDEKEAFAAQVAALGAATTLLVDTFDIEQGIRNAVTVAGPELGAIRIDSGDLGAEASRARALLDELGCERTRILVSGDVDEWTIAALADAPVDAFGVGTSVVTGSGSPTAGLIYKLVERDGEPVQKRSVGKATRGGRKYAWRVLEAEGGRARHDVVRTADEPPPGPHRPLQVPLLRGGEIVHRPPLDEIAAHHDLARAELGPVRAGIEPGPPALEVVFEGGRR